MVRNRWGGGSAAKPLNFIGEFFTAAAKPPLGGGSKISKWWGGVSIWKFWWANKWTVPKLYKFIILMIFSGLFTPVRGFTQPKKESTALTRTKNCCREVFVKVKVPGGKAIHVCHCNKLVKENPVPHHWASFETGLLQKMLPRHLLKRQTKTLGKAKGFSHKLKDILFHDTFSKRMVCSAKLHFKIWVTSFSSLNELALVKNEVFPPKKQLKIARK